jgi:2-polyprenyl-3-methyl-5-hydroxy-6-metoxy-1,4-benzoquinol methylase
MRAPRRSLKRFAKSAFWSAVPLGVRKRAAIGISRAGVLSHGHRLRLSMLAVGDLAERDNGAFHKFLWSHHLAYALYYGADERFRSPIETSRVELFSDLERHLRGLRVAPHDVDSILDVGCSVGNNLRYLEEHVFPSATAVHGIDIDHGAVADGSRYLASIGSRIELKAGDMEDLNGILGVRPYDVVFCAGVLLYLDEERAASVVRSMLQRANILCAFAAVAHAPFDNRLLGASETRAWDMSHVHNVDTMVAAAGGHVVARRWESGTLDGRQTIYFVFARPTQG